MVQRQSWRLFGGLSAGSETQPGATWSARGNVAEEPAISKETVLDISGCICERMLAIRSDWEDKEEDGSSS